MSSNRRSRILALWILAWLPAAAALVIIAAAEPAFPGVEGHEPNLAEAREQRTEVNAAIEPHGKRVIARLVSPVRSLESPMYECFEATLVDKGKVRRIDLEQLARELGVVDPFESVQPRWRG